MLFICFYAILKTIVLNVPDVSACCLECTLIVGLDTLITSDKVDISLLDAVAALGINCFDGLCTNPE